ncbi:MAG: hypothetical protein LBF97_07210 [Elusimicrobiota bacterium]|jgi:hypothetical protein|nr:hypothetical protein [Elusimicrobiota bacterium]
MKTIPPCTCNFNPSDKPFLLQLLGFVFFNGTHFSSPLNDTANPNLKIFIGSCFIPTDFPSFLELSEIFDGISETFKNLINNHLKITKYLTRDILLSITINKEKYTFNLPISYINNNIIPSILIPYEISPEKLDSKLEKYFIYFGENKYQVVSYKILYLDQYLLLMPTIIIGDEDKLLNYKNKTYNFYDTNYEFYYPKISLNNEQIILSLKFLDPKRPLPIQIYEEAVKIYTESKEKSQRNVAEIIREKYKLKSFSHTNISRYFKNNIIKTNNVNNKKLNDDINKIVDFNDERTCSLCQQMKLKAKFKYNIVIFCIMIYKVNIDKLLYNINETFINEITVASESIRINSLRWLCSKVMRCAP